MYDCLVIGAGLAGSTVAERLASQLDASVLVVDTRPHIGSNTYDPVDADGLRYHQCGPHIFHTNSRNVVEYVIGLTRLRPYEHRVLARVEGFLVPIPINRTTINALYRLELDVEGVRTFLASRAQPSARIDNSERAIVSRSDGTFTKNCFAVHAQTMGTRSSRSRPDGVRSHPDANRRRRSIFFR